MHIKSIQIAKYAIFDSTIRVILLNASFVDKATL